MNALGVQRAASQDQAQDGDDERRWHREDRMKFRKRGRLKVTANATGYAGDQASLRVRRPRR